ncbi:MAG TPA: hypothetical protein VFL34_11855 [Candidatus Sulfotelmatobacter sp.]|nr:hypothetical protein [Candidatus Sulfotelmatobacter sp.]
MSQTQIAPNVDSTASQPILRVRLSQSQHYLVIAALFSFCIAPTFISYQPYRFAWDESDYFARSIAASRAFWSRDVRGLGAAMVSIRPPMMTLLGIPWGPLRTWEEASKCFITLAAAIALMVAMSLYLLLRIGPRPVFLIAASLCTWLSMGLQWPQSLTHACATAFLADTFFAWTALAAALLIPLEARTNCSTTLDAVLRGALWAVIISLGAMTKLNFLYFVALIMPALAFLRFRLHGPLNALAAMAAFTCCSAPSAIYLIRYGHLAFENLKASSFGSIAGFYNRPLLSFLAATTRDTPGMAVSFLLIATSLLYLAIRRRLARSRADLGTLVIMIGFAIIVFSATNRQIRYAFPAVVALPFLTALLMSGEQSPTSRRTAAMAAIMVFCGLLVASVPMRHRPDARSLSRCNAVLAAAERWNAHQILLATDSPNLNSQLMELATLFSSRPVLAGTLAYGAMYRLPVEEDFGAMNNADLIVFQDRFRGEPQFTNQRVAQYEAYAQRIGNGPIRITDDMYVYRIHTREQQQNSQ